jgi:Ca2+-binding EF-hand superfamily protein
MVGAMLAVDPDDVMRSLVEKLSEKKMRATDLFKKIDTSGDGSLDADELRAGLSDVGWRGSDAEFAVIMARVDKDGGGDVSLKEFDRAIKAAEKLPKKKLVEEVVVQKKKQGITAEDREEFRQIFCLFKQLTKKEGTEDAPSELVAMDTAGTISTDELEQLLEGVGMKLRPDDIHNMIGDLDKDHNGNIDFEEFCSAMAKEIQVDHEPDDIAKCFKGFARNAPDGYIRVEDLRNALTTYMHKDLSLNDVNELLVHYQDCFVRLPGYEVEFFNYQDYIDLMSPLADRNQDV